MKTQYKYRNRVDRVTSIVATVMSKGSSPVERLDLSLSFRNSKGSEQVL